MLEEEYKYRLKRFEERGNKLENDEQEQLIQFLLKYPYCKKGCNRWNLPVKGSVNCHKEKKKLVMLKLGVD